MKRLITLTIALTLSVLAFGQTVRETLEVSTFNRLEVSGAYRVFIRQGPTQEVVAIGSEDAIDGLKVEVSNGQLEISTRGFLNTSNSDVRLFITVTQLKSISISGAVSLEAKNRIDGSDLDIEASGAADMDLKVDMSNVKVSASGAAEINLEGRARSCQIELSGSSSLDAEEWLVSRMSIEISGASSADVHAIETLEVEASGASSVTYRGNPTVDSDISYASSLTKK
ncbi:head GIN domain-containing protein [Phaeocystidibacter marisrubri]|uniref:DUF2807 domain-containing protein n=1 Tax=Phaeocystidibacter marisrubri TaxID=1577780 RepID=A0A6L3ZIV0_9FLAO|nr:head GIN domain-containing protein [Phaeocystidibacter marisrubri]KAB2817519.1 DUF2807 domain-containing protein [Phaeocystidibacter marisrubri]GGH74943.1 hypothetical protein GCM10011318_21450 [Phaeocystidibacter marisrubri]